MEGEPLGQTGCSPFGSLGCPLPPSPPLRPIRLLPQLFCATPHQAPPRDLGVGFVPHSPLGHGFPAGQVRSTADISDDDWRKTSPRFVGENFRRNLRIVDEAAEVAPLLPRSRWPGCSHRAASATTKETW